MVIPRSRSAFSLSRTHAGEKSKRRADHHRRWRAHTILEGSLAHFIGFLLELFDGTYVDTTALVDQMSRRRRLS